MARYIGPVCKLCRREGEKLFLKGERCQTEKCAFTRRPYPPGQHGQGRIKMSEYAIRLREKQKVRRVYGVQERQFRLYYDRANRMRGGTGELVQMAFGGQGFVLVQPAESVVEGGHQSSGGQKGGGLMGNLMGG